MQKYSIYQFCLIFLNFIISRSIKLLISTMDEKNRSFVDRALVKLPPIPFKSKSMMSHLIPKISSLDLVTAKSWYYRTPNAQHGFKSNIKRSIASLTKIMTALCVLQLCSRFKMDLQSTYFKATQWSVATIGTTANLQADAWVSVEDLLYGLLLASGNDAAEVLAENIGAVLYFNSKGQSSLISEIRSIDVSDDYESVRFYTQQFVVYMNKKAQQLQMFKTRFANPHGMDNSDSFSTCEDVYLMSKEAMKQPVFRKIVSTVTHKGLFKFHRHPKVITKAIFWTNTNKLLQRDGIIGLKTGITNRAGGCLSTCFLIDHLNQGFVVVLGCPNAQQRFASSLHIIHWASSETLLP